MHSKLTMKTTTLIQFTVLAAVALASANVSASDTCYRQPGPDGRSSRGSPFQIALCLMNLVATGNLNPISIMKCMARNEEMMNLGENYESFVYHDLASLRSSRGDATQIILCLINLVTTGNVTPSAVLNCMITTYGGNNFAHFLVKNGESVGETGTIMNAELTWGKWQVHGRDVDTVNNIEFDSSKGASFTAVGRDFAASGAEGFFEIHENGKKIAVVHFDIPFIGTNMLHIEQVDKRYLCDDKGFGGSGSPTIRITCHKISGSRMY